MIQKESSPFNLPASFTTSSPEETFAVGRGLAGLLEKGGVVALTGPLGAGKTRVTKGIARGLGVEEEVTSPTYTIVSEYEAVLASGEKIPFYHIDAYRLRGDDDFGAIGGEEIVFGKGVSVIEWSERIPGFIPKEALKVEIEITGNDERKISLYAEGSSCSGEDGK